MLWLQSIIFKIYRKILYVSQVILGEYITTAWFIDQIEKWFYLLTIKSPVNAIGKLDEDVYAETFLTNFVGIVDSMEVRLIKIWKPSEIGMLMSAKSILDIQHLPLNEEGYMFILTGRFFKGCFENVFSILRTLPDIS